MHATMNLLRPVAQAETVEIYFLSQQARFKLIRESNVDAPDLRKLLAHANLVDLLADELQSRKPKSRIHFAQTVIPETFQESGWQTANYDSSDDDSSSSSSSDEEDDQDDQENEEGELIEIEYVEDHVALVGQGLLSHADPGMSLKVHGLHHQRGPCEAALSL